VILGSASGDELPVQWIPARNDRRLRSVRAGRADRAAIGTPKIGRFRHPDPPGALPLYRRAQTDFARTRYYPHPAPGPFCSVEPPS